MNEQKNICWHDALISRAHREKQNGHKSVILWFTGLSGAGKSTLAHAVEKNCMSLAAVPSYLMATMSVTVYVRILVFQEKIALKTFAELVKWRNYLWKPV